MVGKASPEELDSYVFERTGAVDPSVLQGPAYGEDAAAIQLGDDVLVVNADPISMAVGRIGTLGVHVACNDVAACGARPRWLNDVVFLPGSSEEVLDEITRQLDEAARELGVSIVGGHTEYAPELTRPMLVLTCFGLADRYVPSSGARPGDRLILTKSAGIEATAIVATDFRDRLSAVPESTVDRALGFYDDVSVVEEGVAVAEYTHAMHDPTEGGLVAGLVEMAVASGVEFRVDRESIPVREETQVLCEAVGVDPLRTFGSGALVVATDPDETDETLAAIRERGIEATVVGDVVDVAETDTPRVVLDGEVITEAGRDEMYALWE